MTDTLNQLKQRIERYDIISFDIFDTLLARPYAKPTDLFRHLELLENEPGFAERRIAAEREARRSSENGEVTFDEIYAWPRFQTKIPKEREIELERRILRPIPGMKELYDYARSSGKKIVLVSDMYHSAETIGSFLRACGYDGWTNIYVSSEYRQSKSRTGLYRKMLADVGIPATRVLHIGDRFRADFFAPKLVGIDSVRVKRPLERWFAAHKSERRFYKKNRDSLAASIFVGLAALHALRFEQRGPREPDGGYWENIGYALCGPVCFGYDKFIEADCKTHGVTDLFFVARDGWTLQKVFELFGDSDISARYVYAMRTMKHLSMLTTENDSLEQYRQLIDYYAEQSEELRRAVPESFSSAKESKEFLQAHRGLIEPLRARYQEDVSRYMHGLLRGKGIVGAVDSLTRRFSSQRLVENALDGRAVRGYYWSVLKTGKRGNRFDCVTYHQVGTNLWFDRKIFTKRWDFMEFLLSSPEPPIEGVSSDGAPIFSSPIRPEEWRRMARYEKISAGALKLAHDLLDVLGRCELSVPATLLVDKVNAFLDFPSALDKKMFGDVYFAMDPKHTVYRRLMLCRPTFKEMVTFQCFSAEYVKTVLLTPWRTPAQSLLAFVLRPLATLYLRRYFTKFSQADDATEEART